jgi:hypothetical protein
MNHQCNIYVPCHVENKSTNQLKLIPDARHDRAASTMTQIATQKDMIADVLTADPNLDTQARD